MKTAGHSRWYWTVMIAGLLVGDPALAEEGFGPHKDCKMCHSKDPNSEPYEFAVKQDDKTQNPATRKTLQGVSALCLACHGKHGEGEEAKGIDLHASHPIGIAPGGNVKVPKEGLGYSGEEKTLSCASCHDWHPTNKNYKYLRWGAAGKYDLSRFCQHCHVNKGNPEGAGAHGECVLCHSTHEGRGPLMLTEAPNTTTVNPATGKPMDVIGSLCLACHAAEPDGAGYHVIDLAKSHPTGVKPAQAKLPKEASGFAGENVLTCTSCHNQHPVNQTYAYLRWPIKKLSEAPDFCAHCHADKKDQLKQGLADVKSPHIGTHTLWKGVKSFDDYLKAIKNAPTKN